MCSREEIELVTFKPYTTTPIQDDTFIETTRYENTLKILMPTPFFVFFLKKVVSTHSSCTVKTPNFLFCIAITVSTTTPPLPIIGQLLIGEKPWCDDLIRLCTPQLPKFHLLLGGVPCTHCICSIYLYLMLLGTAWLWNIIFSVEQGADGDGLVDSPEHGFDCLDWDPDLLYTSMTLNRYGEGWNLQLYRLNFTTPLAIRPISEASPSFICNPANVSPLRLTCLFRLFLKLKKYFLFMVNNFYQMRQRKCDCQGSIFHPNSGENR